MLTWGFGSEIWVLTWGKHSESGFDSGSNGVALIGAFAPNKGVDFILMLQILLRLGIPWVGFNWGFGSK